MSSHTVTRGGTWGAIRLEAAGVGGHTPTGVCLPPNPASPERRAGLGGGEGAALVRGSVAGEVPARRCRIG